MILLIFDWTLYILIHRPLGKIPQLQHKTSLLWPHMTCLQYKLQTVYMKILKKECGCVIRIYNTNGLVLTFTVGTEEWRSSVSLQHERITPEFKHILNST